MAIRLTQKDKDKINRINRSIARKNKQMDNYGVDIYKPIIKAKDFKTRKQLNNYLEEARVYTKGYAFKYRQNKYGTVASNIEIARAKRLADAVSRERAKRFREVAPEEFKSRGKGTGSSIMQRKLMGDDRYSMFDKVNFNFGSLRNRKQLENRIESLRNQLAPGYIEKKNEQLKNNIIKAMQENWGNDGKKAIDYIKNMDSNDVVKEFMSEDVFDFRYIYDRTRVKRQVEIFEATYNIT